MWRALLDQVTHEPALQEVSPLAKENEEKGGLESRTVLVFLHGVGGCVFVVMAEVVVADWGKRALRDESGI